MSETVYGASHTEEATSEDTADVGGREVRQRSTIKFPYTDIRDAVAVATKLNQEFGTEATTDQLAAAFSQKTSSGSFRTKIATAAVFGAVESRRGAVALTDLGHELADPRRREAAMPKAFLNVELYRALYEKYRGGKTLPNASGMESEFRSLGVLPSQADRARQAFQRSANEAGFFWAGTDRLTEPKPSTLGGAGGEPAKDGEHRENPPEGGSTNGGQKLSDAPLLKALWDTLPEGDFTTDARKRFFTALAFNIDYVYGPPNDGGGLDPQGVANLWTKKRDDAT